MKTIDGRYELVEKIGDGGMGEVFRAIDLRLRRPVALKRLNLIGRQSDVELFLARFQREAIAMAGLLHPNIVPIYDYGEYDQFPYLVMAYMPGGTLKQRMGKLFDPSQAAAILRPIADALDFIHAHSMIHRDMKPSNILFSERDEPLLSDFGVVKLLEESGATLTGLGGVGTPAYMAPEQIRKSFDWRVDQYALGIVFYEMLTGVKPFDGDTPMETLWKHNVEPLKDPRVFAPALADDFCRVIHTLLMKDPEDRYSSMSEVVTILDQLALGKPVQNPPLVEKPPAPAEMMEQKLTQVFEQPEPEVDETMVDAVSRVLRQAPDPGESTATGAAGTPTELVIDGKASYLEVDEKPVEALSSMSMNETDSLSEQRPEPAHPIRTFLRKIPIWVFGIVLAAVLGGLGIIFRDPVMNSFAKIGSVFTQPTATRTPRPTVTPHPTLRPTKTRIPPTAAPAVEQRRRDGAEIVFIEQGYFQMGLSDELFEWMLAQPWCAECPVERFEVERPMHEVFLSAYWIDRHEVTNEQFMVFTNETGHVTQAEEFGEGMVPRDFEWIWQPGASWKNPEGPASSIEGKEMVPVVQVSWFDAMAYCAWVGGRLPTEAEWEKAARGVDARLFPWGNEPPNGELVNFNSIHGGMVEVNAFPAGESPYGVLNLAGNAAEWTLDTFAPRIYDEGFQTNPTGPEEGEEKTIRGGSWRSSESWVRTTMRVGMGMDLRFSTTGFRCVIPNP